MLTHGYWILTAVGWNTTADVWMNLATAHLLKVGGFTLKFPPVIRITAWYYWNILDRPLNPKMKRKKNIMKEDQMMKNADFELMAPSPLWVSAPLTAYVRKVVFSTSRQSDGFSLVHHLPIWLNLLKTSKIFLRGHKRLAQKKGYRKERQLFCASTCQKAEG